MQGPSKMYQGGSCAETDFNLVGLIKMKKHDAAPGK